MWFSVFLICISQLPPQPRSLQSAVPISTVLLQSTTTICLSTLFPWPIHYYDYWNVLISKSLTEHNDLCKSNKSYFCSSSYQTLIVQQSNGSTNIQLFQKKQTTSSQNTMMLALQDNTLTHIFSKRRGWARQGNIFSCNWNVIFVEFSPVYFSDFDENDYRSNFQQQMSIWALYLWQEMFTDYPIWFLISFSYPILYDCPFLKSSFHNLVVNHIWILPFLQGVQGNMNWNLNLNLAFYAASASHT